MCLLTISCVENKQKDVKRDYLKDLKLKAVNGKKSSYDYLVDYYNNNPSESYDLLPISILAADKYNYSNACVMININLVQMANDGKYHDSLFKNLNNGNKRMSLYYLEKGAKANDLSCISILENLNRNGWGIEKNILKADSLLKVEKKLFPRTYELD